MSIPVTIYDSRNKKEFTSKSDKIPVEKIIKTPGLTVHCICFVLEKDVIIIKYHFNEAFDSIRSFRKYEYPEVELGDSVIDELIDLIYNKLYDPNALYIYSESSIEYPQDAILDIYDNKYIKYKKGYKPVLEISFEEKEPIELSETVKDLLMSPEPDFECPEQYKHINWAECLGFQPDKIILENFGDINVLSLIKSKLNLTVLRYHRQSEEVDTESNFYTINKIGNYKIINENLLVDKVGFSDCIICKTSKNTYPNYKTIIEKVN
jgi:hypothetical protein